jgi:hypothetical protein
MPLQGQTLYLITEIFVKYRRKQFYNIGYKSKDTKNIQVVPFQFFSFGLSFIGIRFHDRMALMASMSPTLQMALARRRTVAFWYQHFKNISCLSLILGLYSQHFSFFVQKSRSLVTNKNSQPCVIHMACLLGHFIS